jgi:hypothetical protein
MPVELLGRTEPRLSTPPLRELMPATTLGFDAARFAKVMLGLKLMPWQHHWLNAALELNPDGSFRHRVLVTLVGRQSGKSTLMRIVALFMAYTRGAMVLGAAQSLDLAVESWRSAVALAEGDPELAAEIASIRRVNGGESLNLRNGGRYRVTAASRSAGRGLSVDVLALDELREMRTWEPWSALSATTLARPNAITMCFSNAGDASSVVLNDLRARALGGAEGVGLLEWSAPDNADLDDPAAWAQAVPALGYTVTAAAIRGALAADPPPIFRTEILCRQVSSLEGAVPADAWNACLDVEQTLEGVRDRVCLGLDVSPDLSRAALVAAGLDSDGRVLVEVVRAWSGPRCTADLRAELPGLLERVRPRVVGWFPAGPAAALANDLRGVRAGQEIKAADVGAVCAGFAEQVGARRVTHNGDPLLAGQVTSASRLAAGGGWRFGRSPTGVEAVYAAAAAVHLARSLRVASRPIVLVARSA